MAGGFPLMAIGAGLGLAAQDINKQREQQANMGLQMLRMRLEQQRFLQELALKQQQLGTAQALGALDPTAAITGAGAGGAADAGTGGMAVAPGENQSPYVGGAGGGGPSFGTGLHDPAALVKRYESSGNYNAGFGGTDLSRAPLDATGFPQWPGKMGPAGISHAAGAFQFEPATWRPAAERLGIHDFSPQSQNAVFNAVSKGGTDLSAWAPYNPALRSALRASQGTPYQAMPQQQAAGGPAGGTPGSTQTDAAGPYRIPTTYGSEAADKAIFGAPGGRPPPDQVAQASPATMTDAGPQGAPQAQGAGQYQLPPPPKLRDPAQAEAALRQQVMSVPGGAASPAGKDYIARGMAAVNAHNAALKAAYEMQVSQIKFQAEQQNRQSEMSARAETQKRAGYEPAFNAQIVTPDGKTRSTMVYSRKGEPGFWDQATGQKLPANAQVHKVSGQQVELPPEIEAPEKWEGMPNKPPPGSGLRQDIWDGALSYVQTGQMPAMGLGSSAIRDQIFAAEPAARRALGIEASGLAATRAQYAGERHGNIVLSGRLANLETSINEAKKLGPAVVTASTNVGRTDLGPFFNRFVTGARLQSGDPNIVAFQGALNSFLNTYARGINPTGRMTDSQQNHAYEVLNTAMSQGQIERGIQQLTFELDMMKSGLGEAVQDVPQMFRPPALRGPEQLPPQDPSLAPQGGGAHPPVPPPLQGKALQWSPSKQQFRDEQGNLYDQNGNLVMGNAGPQL